MILLHMLFNHSYKLSTDINLLFIIKVTRFSTMPVCKHFVFKSGMFMRTECLQFSKMRNYVQINTGNQQCLNVSDAKIIYIKLWHNETKTSSIIPTKIMVSGKTRLTGKPLKH